MIHRQALPFTPTIKHEQGEAEQAAAQLNKLIDEQEAAGWSFSHLESLTTIRPGSRLSGAPTTQTIQLAIFERE